MNYSAWGVIASASWLGVLLAIANGFQQSALSQPPTPKPQSWRQTCPKDVETLTTLLIRDLPNYANRAIQRASSRTKIADFTYMILAGRPEFKTLTLGPGSYNSTSGALRPEEPQQVFLTTLERQYTTGKAIELQQYHWLFLTQTPDGWRLATMFSQIGSYPSGDPPSPPRESSNSVIGQAILTWLEDCRAGVIRALPATPVPKS